MNPSLRFQPSSQFIADNSTFKVDLFTNFLILFPTPLSFWDPLKFRICVCALLKYSSSKCPTCLYLWNCCAPKLQIFVLVLTYPRRYILLFHYTITHDLVYNKLTKSSSTPYHYLISCCSNARGVHIIIFTHYLYQWYCQTLDFLKDTEGQKCRLHFHLCHLSRIKTLWPQSSYHW